MLLEKMVGIRTNRVTINKLMLLSVKRKLPQKYHT